MCVPIDVDKLTYEQRSKLRTFVRPPALAGFPAWFKNEETGMLRLFYYEPRRGKWKRTARKVSHR